MTRRLRVATRGSTLARTQTAWVVEQLGIDAEVVVVQTAGDRRPDADIWQIGGQGVFVQEVEAAVLEGRADFAVHSAKDLRSTLTAGLSIAAVPQRADPRDALVGCRLDTLPTGGRVGTGSVRRRSQLAWLRPDLTFGPLRGNIETRLAKAAGFSAVIIAAAALERLGRLDQADEILDPAYMVPQVGQGALAVECRADDDEVRDRLGRIDHEPSARAVSAERAFLAEVGGGCDLPVGAYATADQDGGLHLMGLVTSVDGRLVVRHAADGTEPGALGAAVARGLFDERGGAAMLRDFAMPPAPAPR